MKGIKYNLLALAISTSFFATSPSADSTENTQLTFSQAYGKYTTAVESENTAESLKYAKLSLRLGEKKFGLDSENATNLKYNLALSLAANQQPQEAFDVFGEIAQRYEELYGEDSMQLMQVLLEQISLNKVYSDNKDTLDFSKVYRKYRSPIAKASSVAEKLAESSPDLAAGSYYGLAKTLNSNLLTGHFFKYAYDANRNAEKYLLESVGEIDKRTIEMRFMLGKYMKAKGRKESAIEYFEQVVSTIDSELDTSHPFELASHAVLVDLYEQRGKSDKATEHCLAIGRMTPWNDEIEPIPLHRVPPDYPLRAARSNKEGYVVLSFDIDTFGFVKNIEIIDSSSNSFEKSGQKALEKWRYAPKFVNGQSVVAEGQKVRLDFRLES